MSSGPGATARHPKYVEIADALRGSITSGAYEPGSRLPSARELEDQHQAALGTVRSAINVLIAEGLVESRHGSGVFVRSFRPIRRRAVSRLSAEKWGSGSAIWESDTEGRALVVDQISVTTTQSAPAGALRLLELDEDAPVVERSRRFVLDGKPVLLSRSYLPAELTEGTRITQVDSGPGGIYARLAERGHAPARFREEVACRMPNRAEAEALAIPSGTPVILVTRVAFTADGRPVECNEMTMDASAYILEYSFPA
jgi:GntR family transcriptional regulator